MGFEEEFIEAQKLAYAWESTGMPLDVIADMHIKMKEKIEYLEGVIKRKLNGEDNL